MPERACALFLTKVLRPPPQRVGQIGNKFTLPRAVPWPQALAAVLGGGAGLFAAAAISPGPIAFIGGAFGGAFGVWLVNLKPWEGEHVGKVGLVHLQSWAGAKQTICPGSSLPITRDPRSGAEHCCKCGLICDVVVDENLRIATTHTWKREVYMGCQKVKPEPLEYRVIPGSVEV